MNKKITEKLGNDSFNSNIRELPIQNNKIISKSYQVILNILYKICLFECEPFNSHNRKTGI